MSADIEATETPVEIDWAPAGHNGTVTLTVRQGDEVIHADKLDLSRHSSRRKFIADLHRDHGGIDQDAVETRLLAILPALEQRRKDHPPAGPRDDAGSPYVVRDNCFFLKCDPDEARLSNFVAEIAEEIVRDDGDEQCRSFGVRGTLQDGRPLSAEVPAGDFAAMDWVLDQFGAEAIIEAGRGLRDHVRAAIQHRSTNIIRRTTYAHTGWREIDGEMVYLHSGGAIRASGLDESVAVNLGKSLENYELPAPPEGERLVEAIRASLGLLRFAQERRPNSRAVAAATICYAYRAAIGRSNHSGQFTGLTGSHKTCMAALGLQHYGKRMNHRDGMPANWDSTANRLEWMMHAVKDAQLVIDDFVPGGSANDVAKAHKEAERVFRSQGNGRGRERLGSDGRARPSKSPRGTVVSTGEDTVRRKSAGTGPSRSDSPDRTPNGEFSGRSTGTC